MKPSVLLSAIVAAFAVPMTANAVPVVYTAELKPEAVAATGTGLATVIFDDIANTMLVQFTFNGLSGTTTAAHIHCCTASAGTGTAGVATQTPFFAGMPIGVTSGAYGNLFDTTSATSFNPSYISGNGGTPASAFAALMAGSAANRAYLNVHTTTFGGGEIRGFLQPVPEPESYVLLIAGLGLVGLAAMRR